MTLRMLTAGESHGPALTVILDGLPAGLPLQAAGIDRELERRQQGAGSGARMKIERDRARLLGGVMAGLTTGAPLAILIENRDHARWRGQAIEPFTAPRPGHADLSGALKYGYRDLRPALERASARETAARVAAGAVCKQLLAQFGITVGGVVCAIGEVSADLTGIPLAERMALAEGNAVRCPEPLAAERMQQRIREVMQAKDTLGGVIEVIALGVPPGLGSYAQWDQRLEARLGAALLSVPAIKGVEIGPAFENSRLPGTQVHDPLRLAAGGRHVAQNAPRSEAPRSWRAERGNPPAGELVRPSNRAGGLEGGVTNGQPLVLRAAMKPIATTLTPQPTVDLARGQEAPTRYERSDFCPVPRAVPVLEAMVAFTLAQALLEKLGGDSLDELRPRFEALRRLRLEDLPLDGTPQVYWPGEEGE